MESVEDAVEFAQADIELCHLSEEACLFVADSFELGAQGEQLSFDFLQVTAGGASAQGDCEEKSAKDESSLFHGSTPPDKRRGLRWWDVAARVGPTYVGTRRNQREDAVGFSPLVPYG